MYKNSQTANNVFHLTLFNQEVKKDKIKNKGLK
jgi:hypothetical protein